MGDSVVVVRCPRCGSMDAESVEAVHVQLDRMRCHACGHEQIADEYQVKDVWNQEVPADSVKKEVWHVLPSERYLRLWGALGARGHGFEVYARLRVAYDEPHRAYHNARHIGSCLRLLDEPAVSALAADPREVEAALWFHDAVYDTRSRDNEEASALMVEECLGRAGVASDAVARIAAHVRATRDHRAESSDGQLVVDVDLSILAAEPEELAWFEEGVRREYAWVDDAAYVRGRSEVLQRFAERESIYRTPLLCDRYESKARDNIAGLLRRLAAKP